MSGGDTKAACGCCQGTGSAAPVVLTNRPGLSALVYRVGTHSGFKEEMLAGISTRPALRALTTRDDGDPTIALLDAWATTLDVLTFYQERIANEGFLRTATERRSVLELARTIGYELRPGVASSTWLAFALDGSPGSPREVIIPAGTRAQSLPTKEELPQSFETGVALLARPEWNALRPRQLEPQTIGSGTKEIFLVGVATQLRPGDALLVLWDQTNSNLRILSAVETRAQEGVTKVTLEKGLDKMGAGSPKVYALRQRAALFGANAPDWKAMTADFKKAYMDAVGFPYTASDPKTWAKDWPGFDKTGAVSEIDLDATYPRIAPQSWVVLKVSPDKVFRVNGVGTASRSDFSLTARVTWLTLDPAVDQGTFTRRGTAVFAESEELTLALRPITKAVMGKTIELEGLVDGLVRGRALIVQGKRFGSVAEDASAITEVVLLEKAASDQERTTLHLTEPLESLFDRTTVQIFANVTPATHGETKHEVLGGGDAAKRFQRFRLRQKPLTYTAAPVPEGGTSTLELRVNGVLWHESPDLYRLGPRDRQYVLRRDDEGNTTVQFGDGIHGARLPSGSENVEAVYRTGIGLPGLVEENRISLLATRPLGVKSVANPVPATGAADPQMRDQARWNAPLTVLTLDRVVSLLDFEDFARSFSGIGKAQARMLWQRGQRLIHLTVAAVGGRPVDTVSALYKNLREAMDRLRDPFQALQVESFDPLRFQLGARVRVDPDFVTEAVLKRVQAVLSETFSAEARELGQSVFLSEVMAVIQRVEGVVYVDVESLHLETKGATLENRIPAHSARIDGAGTVQRAQLLTLSPEPVALEALP